MLLTCSMVSKTPIAKQYNRAALRIKRWSRLDITVDATCVLWFFMQPIKPWPVENDSSIAYGFNILSHGNRLSSHD